MLRHDECVVTLPVRSCRQPAPFEHRQRDTVESEQRRDDDAQRNGRTAHGHARQHLPLTTTGSNHEQTAHGDDATSLKEQGDKTVELITPTRSVSEDESLARYGLAHASMNWNARPQNRASKPDAQAKSGFACAF